MSFHVVEQGECLSSIAKRHGFIDWRLIYHDSGNSELRRLRPNPDVLQPGDVVRIPERELREESRSTDQRHRFKKMSSRTMLRIALEDWGGTPLAEGTYNLRVTGPAFDRTYEGSLPASGLIEVEIAPDADSGLLIYRPPRKAVVADPASAVAPPPLSGVHIADLGHGTGVPHSRGTRAACAGRAEVRDEVWRLDIGRLDPVEEISGIQARLNNLEFDAGEVDGVSGPETRLAVAAFQSRCGQPATGVCDTPTRARLKAAYGC